MNYQQISDKKIVLFNMTFNTRLAGMGLIFLIATYMVLKRRDVLLSEVMLITWRCFSCC